MTKIDNAVKSVLSSLGLEADTVHLTDKFDEFKSVLEKEISVDAWGIAYDLWNNPWEEVKMTKPEIIAHLKKHKNAECYTEYRKPFMNIYGQGGTTFGGYKKINKDSIINADYGTSSKNIGYGSQSSVHIETVALKKDAKGNLMLDRSLQVWD